MTIEERVARLETQNVRLCRVVVVLGVFLVLAAGMGAATMQNRDRMTLEDKAGRTRIELFVHPDFGPYIGFYDNTGRQRIRVGSDQNRDGLPFIHFLQDDVTRPVKIIVP